MLRSITRTMLVMLPLLSVSLIDAARAQDVPFTGVVVQDGVKVRAGAGRAYYVVGELKKGAVVQVDEVIFGWNKIVSPPGVQSYISKAFVDARGNGRIGQVNTDRVEVKAGSIKGPGESYRGQVQLNKGDSVDILDEEGSFYKITPPAGAYVFLPPGSVRRADPAALAAASESAQPTPADPASAPSSKSPESPETAPAAAEPEPEEAEPAVPAQPTLREAMTQQPPEPGPIQRTPAEPDADTQTASAPPATDPAGDEANVAGTASPDEPAAGVTADQGEPDAGQSPEMTKGGTMQTAAVSDSLKALEARMIPLFMQPLEQQPIEQMIQAYENVQRQSLPPIDRQIVSLRLAVLRRNLELAGVLRRLQDSAGDVTQVTLPDESLASGSGAETPGAGVAGATGPVSYDAVGKLLASSVYDGIHLPRMFRVVDPASGRTILWVDPGGPVDPRQYLGKVVGLVGPQQYDPALKFNVMDVNRIDVLEAQATP